MTEVKIGAKAIETKSGTNFTCAHLGPFDQLAEYETTIRERKVRGKVFLREFVNFTSLEVSYTTVPPGKGSPFVHHHKQDEEAYIFIQGSGRMQIDDDIFDVSEGTIVRVATPGKRAIGNNSDRPLVYICVQAKEGSLEQCTFDDGVRDDAPPKV